MEQAARLDSLLEKGDARSLAEALAELGKTLAALSQALDKNADDFTTNVSRRRVGLWPRP